MSALTLALQAPFRLVDLEISATRQIAKVTIYIQDSSGRDEDSCTVWYATAESSPRMNDEFPIGRETVYRMNGSTIRTLLHAGASIHMLSSDTGGEYTRISAGASSEEKPGASALASGRQDASKPIDDPFAGEQSRNVASDGLPLNSDSSA